MMKKDPTRGKPIAPPSNSLSQKKELAREDRKQKLAAALRENLKKRKEQIRARQQQGAGNK